MTSLNTEDEPVPELEGPEVVEQLEQEPESNLDIPVEFDPYVPEIQVDTILTAETEAEVDEIFPKKITAAEIRNYFRFYNEKARAGRTTFAPELGIGPTTKLKTEKQVACCGLQCALIWSGFVDLAVSGALVLIFSFLVAKHRPYLRFELTLISAFLFLALSSVLFAGVTRRKKNNILLWSFILVNPVLLLVSFMYYFLHYFSFPGWEMLVGTAIVAGYKTYQSYLVVLFIWSPTKARFRPNVPDTEFPEMADDEIGLRPLTSLTYVQIM